MVKLVYSRFLDWLEGQEDFADMEWDEVTSYVKSDMRGWDRMSPEQHKNILREIRLIYDAGRISSLNDKITAVKTIAERSKLELERDGIIVEMKRLKRAQERAIGDKGVILDTTDTKSLKRRERDEKRGELREFDGRGFFE